MRSRNRAIIVLAWALAVPALELSGAAPGLGRLQWTLETGG